MEPNFWRRHGNPCGEDEYVLWSMPQQPKGRAPTLPTDLCVFTQSIKFCVMIKLGDRKVFIGFTTPREYGAAHRAKILIK